MNHLTDRFPEAVRIDGEIYPLNTDFRVGLKIMTAFEDKRLTWLEKQLIMVGLLFKGERQPDFSKACAAARKFLDCGEAPRESDGSPRVYSFSKDARYIYSAILQTHGVDLQTAQLHWWKFCAMFNDLAPDTAFHNLLSLRRRRAAGQLTTEEKRIWMEMEDVLSLDDLEDDPEREAALAEFNRLMGG